ncbi:hypothetical protein [Acinetobacter sp. PW68]|uniref:hypothetical protein n=1 Tax=Acinetobacter sp. PW68 TaxID=2865162 RepID=UPI002282E7EB|nr:hypothetical protein [Acinetobacter sp. PW68]
MDSGFFTFFLSLTLSVMMMGLGLQLTPRDFIRVSQFPKVIFLTLLSQLVILPVLASLCSTRTKHLFKKYGYIAVFLVKVNYFKNSYSNNLGTISLL